MTEVMGGRIVKKNTFKSTFLWIVVFSFLTIPTLFSFTESMTLVSLSFPSTEQEKKGFG